MSCGDNLLLIGAHLLEIIIIVVVVVMHVIINCENGRKIGKVRVGGGERES